MQVYQAHTRILIGTATSQNPEDITISNLPPDYEELLLFIRTMDSKSITSDANIIYVGKSKVIGKRNEWYLVDCDKFGGGSSHFLTICLI